METLWVDKGNVKRLKRVENGEIELEGVKSGENAWYFEWNEIESEKWTKIEVSKKSLGKWGCSLFSGRFRFGVQFLRAAFYWRLKLSITLDTFPTRIMKRSVRRQPPRRIFAALQQEEAPQWTSRSCGCSSNSWNTGPTEKKSVKTQSTMVKYK